MACVLVLWGGGGEIEEGSLNSLYTLHSWHRAGGVLEGHSEQYRFKDLYFMRRHLDKLK